MPALYAFDETTRYVDTVNGNDANDGETEATAWATLGEAKTTAPSGSTIFVAPGEYNENDLFGDFTWVFCPGAKVVYSGGGTTALFDGTDNGLGAAAHCRVLGHGTFQSTTGIISLAYANSRVEFEFDNVTSSGPIIEFPFAESGIHVHVDGKHASSSSTFISAGTMQAESVANVTGKIAGFTALSANQFIAVGTANICNIDLEIGMVTIDEDASPAVAVNGGTCVLRNGTIKSVGYCLSNFNDESAKIILNGVTLLPTSGVITDSGGIFLDATCCFDKSHQTGDIKFGALSMVQGINEPRTLYVDAVNGNTYNSGTSRGAAFQLLQEAKTAAQSGDTIVVLRGTYDEKNLAKNGVNWHFESGAVLTTSTESTVAVWDDGPDGTNGACFFKVTGEGQFDSTWGDMSMISLRHQSRVSIQCDSLSSVGKLIDITGGAQLTLDVGHSLTYVSGSMITVDSGARLNGKIATIIQDASVYPNISVLIDNGGFMSMEFDYFQSSALTFFDVTGDGSFLRLNGGIIRHVNAESLEPHGVIGIATSNIGRADLHGINFLIGPEEEGLPRFELSNEAGQNSVINVDATCRVDHVRTSGQINYADTSVLAMNNHKEIDGYNIAQAMAILMAVAAGKLDGSGTNNPIIRSLNDTIDRVVAEVDSVGNRIDISIDVEDLA